MVSADVKQVGRVSNHQMPFQMEKYLHRAGRTAKAGRQGLAINFVKDNDKALIEHLKSTNTPQ